MKLSRGLLFLSLFFILPACSPSIKKSEFDYDKVYKKQYPVAISSDYVMHPTTLQQQGITYGNGSITVFPIDNRNMTAGANGNYNSNTPSRYSDLAPVTSYNYQQNTNLSNSGSYNNYNSELELFFRHGSAHLGSLDKEKIAKLAEFLKSSNSNAVVAGYSSKTVHKTNDPTQQDIINLRMSSKRANSVTEQLYKYGVTPEKLTTISFGATHISGDDKKDRKVEIKVR